MKIYAVGVTTPTVSEGIGPSRVLAESADEAKSKFAIEEGRDVAGLEAAGMTQWMVTLIEDLGPGVMPEPIPEPEPDPIPEAEPVPVAPEPDPEPQIEGPIVDPNAAEPTYVTVLPTEEPQEEETA